MVVSPCILSFPSSALHFFTIALRFRFAAPEDPSNQRESRSLSASSIPFEGKPPPRHDGAPGSHSSTFTLEKEEQDQDRQACKAQPHEVVQEEEVTLLRAHRGVQGEEQLGATRNPACLKSAIGEASRPPPRAHLLLRVPAYARRDLRELRAVCRRGYVYAMRPAGLSSLRASVEEMEISCYEPVVSTWVAARLDLG
jgi:hypothetical protein